MASLPKGWESDYDGSRWFFVYRPTGQIQYQFPKPGDEFPDFIDSFAPAPVLLPEEKLESQQQVKRRSTTGSSSRARAAAQREREASALPAIDDEGGFEYSFESFGYLGPQSYNDVSPLNDEDDEEDKGPGRAAKVKEGVGKDSPANASTPGERPHVSPMTSAGTTPQVGKTEPASGTPIMGETVMGESATVHTIIEEPIMSEPIMSAPVLGVDTAGVPPQGHAQGATQSPTVPMLDGTEVSPPPAPAFSPVGFMPELYSDSTAQCHEETNPPPVELPDNAIWVEPIQTIGFVNEHPVELPTHHSPVEQRPQEPAPAPPSPHQQVAPQQAQYPYGISASFASVSPKLQGPTSPPTGTTAGKPAESGSQPGNYQPWNPSTREDDNSTKRGSVILGNVSIAESQRNELGPLDKRQSGSPASPPKIDPNNVPASLAPKIPPKRPIGDDEAGSSSKATIQPPGTVHPLMPGGGTRHASISNPPDQPAGLSHFPSVLKPGPRQAMDRASGVTLSNQPFQAQQKPYMAYQPAHPMPGVPLASYAQLIQPRQYQAMPPSNSHPGPLRPGPGQPTTMEPRPGMPRTNTVPNQLPSQVPLPIVTPPPVGGPNTHQEIDRNGPSQAPSFGTHRMSTGNIHVAQGQLAIVQDEPTVPQPANTSLLSGGNTVIEERPTDNQAAAHWQGHVSQPSTAVNTNIHAVGSVQNQSADVAGTHPAPQRWTIQNLSPPQHFVMGDSMESSSATDTRLAQTSEPNLHNGGKLQHGNIAHHEPQNSFIMDESIVVQAPVTQLGRSHTSQISDEPQGTPQKGEASSDATKIETNQPNAVSDGEKAPEPVEMGQKQQSQASQAPKDEQKRAATEAFTVTSEVTGVVSSGYLLAGHGPESNQTQHEQTVREEHAPMIQAPASEVAGHPADPTRGPEQPSIPSQASIKMQSGPDVLKNTPVIEHLVSQNQVLQDQQATQSQNTNSTALSTTYCPQGGRGQQSLSSAQQSSGQQQASWQQMSQMPPQYLSANSPVGPWSVANLPGMAVLQQNNSFTQPPPGQQMRDSSISTQQRPPNLQPQPPMQSTQLIQQQVQSTAPMGDQDTAPQHGTHIPNQAPQKNSPSTAANQGVQLQGQALPPQARPPMPQLAPTQPKHEQVSHPTATLAVTQQQAMIAGAAGQRQQPGAAQQPQMAQGQGAPIPGAVSAQIQPQVIARTNPSHPQSQPQPQPQARPGQPGQPQRAMASNQYGSGQQPNQQPQSFPVPQSHGYQQHPQPPMPGTITSGPLPLQTASSQQTGSSGSNPATIPPTEPLQAGPQSPVSARGSQPNQSMPGQPQGVQPQSGPGLPMPSNLPGAATPLPQAGPNQAQPGQYAQGTSAPASLPGQNIQVQDFQRHHAVPLNGMPAPSNVARVGGAMQPQPQLPSTPQVMNAASGITRAVHPGSTQLSGQGVGMPNTTIQFAPHQMQNMQPNRGPAGPSATGQIPYNPRMFPPMPAPLVTQQFNGQQPGWGQPGTPTQSGPQSPSSQRRSSQQSVTSTTPNSRRTSGYQIHPGTQSPVLPQQMQFPPSQQAQPSAGSSGKEKNWFSKMWKNPSSKKGAPSSGAVPAANTGVSGPLGNVQGPSKLQKPQLPPGSQGSQQPQGFPMAYNVPPHMLPQMQGVPGPYGQPPSNNMTRPQVSGMQQQIYQGAPVHMQGAMPSHQRNPSQPVFTPGTTGQTQQGPKNPQGVNWPQQRQGSLSHGMQPGLPVGYPNQHTPGPAQVIQQPVQQQPGQGPSDQARRGQQGMSNQQHPMYYHQQPHQGPMMGGTGGASSTNAAPQQTTGSQPQVQQQAPQGLYQTPVPPQQQQLSSEGQQSESTSAAVAAIAGLIGAVASNQGNTTDDSCVVAPLFSGNSPPSAIPAPANGSIGGDSGYAVVDAGDTVSVDVETVSVVDSNGNAWTTSSIDYEGNDWGETW